MALTDGKSMKAELEEYRKKLSELDIVKNWDSLMKNISTPEQSKMFQGGIQARTLLNTFIPKFEFKIDAFLSSAAGKKYDDLFDEWSVLKTKIMKALDTCGKFGPDYGASLELKAKNRKEKDEQLSDKIEKSLKLKKLAALEQPPRSFLSREEDCSGSRETSDCGDSSRNPNRSIFDEIKNLRKFIKESGDSKDIVGGNYSKLNSGKIKDQERTKTEANINDHRRASTANIRGGDDDSGSQEDQKEIEKHSKNRRRVKSKKRYPSPVPIDNILNFVETLPKKAQELVKQQTDTLNALRNKPIYGPKEMISSHNGMMVDLNKLKSRDERFDGSEFRLRVDKSKIDFEQIAKELRDNQIDDAVGRGFGSFQGKKPEGELFNE